MIHLLWALPALKAAAHWKAVSLPSADLVYGPPLTPPPALLLPELDTQTLSGPLQPRSQDVWFCPAATHRDLARLS